MEQRIDSIDETMIRNTLMIPSSSYKTDIPRPKLVELNFDQEDSDVDQEILNNQINEVIKDSYPR